MPPSPAPAGYSGTPLARKLGIKATSVVYLIDAPPHYRSLVDPLPQGARVVSRLTALVDVVHLFATNRAALEKTLAALRQAIRADAAVWVSWPKKASRVPTSITEDTIRDVALPLGLVDIKVCAVDATWSGLKLVIRKELR